MGITTDLIGALQSFLRERDARNGDNTRSRAGSHLETGQTSRRQHRPPHGGELCPSLPRGCCFGALFPGFCARSGSLAACLSPIWVRRSPSFLYVTSVSH